jgi:uncharacterized membrane protein YgdD (TMEM256/DUF423 family)
VLEAQILRAPDARARFGTCNFRARAMVLLGASSGMTVKLIVFGAISAFIGVAAGAFGAHGLGSRLPADLLAVYETGVRYELVHALALLFVGLAAARWPSRHWTRAGWSFVAGTVLFSGSLYALALTGTRGLGAITPIGGICFLLGWTFTGWAAWRAVPGAPERSEGSD